MTKPTCHELMRGFRPERASRLSVGRSPTLACVGIKPCKGVRIMRAALSGLNKIFDRLSVGLRPTLRRDALSGRKIRTATPRGLNIKAQGCAYPRYPGCKRIKNVNPNGVAHYHSVNTTPAHCLHDHSKPTMCNPVGVDIFSSRPPRVARVRATLGFDVKPLWGCLTRVV